MEAVATPQLTTTQTVKCRWHARKSKFRLRPNRALRRAISLPVQQIYRIAYNPQKQGVVYLGASELGVKGTGVFRSTDGGETWADDNTGLLSLDIAALMISPQGVVYVGTANGVYFKRAD